MDLDVLTVPASGLGEVWGQVELLDLELVPPGLEDELIVLLQNQSINHKFSIYSSFYRALKTGLLSCKFN